MKSDLPLITVRLSPSLVVSTAYSTYGAMAAGADERAHVPPGSAPGHVGPATAFCLVQGTPLSGLLFWNVGYVCGVV